MTILKYKEGYLFLEVNGRDRVDMDLVEKIRKNSFDGAIAFEYREDKKAFRYTIKDLVSLRVRGSQSIDKKEMVHLFYHLFKAMQSVMERGILPNFIDWTPDLIFLDRQGQIYLLTYPLEKKSVEGDGIFGLMVKLIKNLKPFEKRDETFLESIKKNIDLVDSGEVSKEQFIYEFKKLIYKHYKQIEGYRPVNIERLVQGQEPEPEVVEEEDDLTTTLAGVDYSLDGILLEVQENTVYMESPIIEDDDHTQIMDTEESAKVYIGYLTRTNGDSFEVSASEIYFGKATKKGNMDVDYQLSGNSAISRKHFKITRVGDEFYLSDVGSTNGTWLDGQRLVVSESMELVNGSKIRVADEEMTFIIKEVQ